MNKFVSTIIYDDSVAAAVDDNNTDTEDNDGGETLTILSSLLPPPSPSPPSRTLNFHIVHPFTLFTHRLNRKPLLSTTHHYTFTLL